MYIDRLSGYYVVFLTGLKVQELIFFLFYNQMTLQPYDLRAFLLSYY